MTTETLFLTLMAETSIHAGASESEGVVDLPVQREKHNDWPCVFGSGVKGAMRAKAQTIEGLDTKSLFGPDPKDNNGSDYAGSLQVTDARLLLLPVRSLTGHYRWVCCPALLKRLERDLHRAGRNNVVFNDEVKEEEVLLGKENKAQTLYLEEYAFSVKDRIAESGLSLLKSILPEDHHKELENKLAVISNDNFRHLCRAAIPVNAHIAIDSDTKTVKNGALWYEESLAPDTIMYTIIVVQKSRNGKMSAAEGKAAVTEQLFATPYLQVGGNETTGMGWFKVNQVQEEA